MQTLIRLAAIGRLPLAEGRFGGAARSLTVSVRSPARSESATVQRLSASGLGATSGVTIGGQTFGSATATAQLTGSIANTVVAATNRRFVVTLPPAGAAMLSVTATGR